MHSSPDWLADLAAFQPAGEKMPLTDLMAGDLLKVTTSRSTYFFRITEPKKRLAEMWKQGRDTPPVLVQLMGGTLGLSSTIDPRKIFCGGSLEYTRDAGARTHTTSAIREIALLRRKPV